MNRILFAVSILLLALPTWSQTSAPVVVFNDTIFYINSQVASFTPQERAKAISRRIVEASEKSGKLATDSIKVIPSEFGFNLEFDNIIMMVVFPSDTIGTQESPIELARQNAEDIRYIIKKHHDDWAFENIIIKIGLTLLAFLVFFIILTVVNKLNKWLLLKIEGWNGTRIKSIMVGSYEFLNAARLVSMITLFVRGLRFFLIILCLYSLLPAVFSIFPETEKWADLLIDYIISPFKSIIISIVNYIPDLIRIIVIYLFTRYTVKGFNFLANEVERGALKLNGFYADWAKPTFNVIQFLLYAFMFIVIWPYLPGSNSPAFQGVSVFLGLLISFGSSSAIANAVAGLVITYMRPFKVGDRVKVGEISGDVIEKNMLVTRIRTIKNEDITMPNSSILSSFSVNYTSQAKEKGLILYSTVTIGYDAPWRTIHELLISAALKTDRLENEPKPFVNQLSLDDFYVSYQINAYTHYSRGMAEIYSELHQHIQDAFNEAGIEIMSPHYGALRNGNTITIPENYRPSNYKPEPFEVKKVE